LGKIVDGHPLGDRSIGLKKELELRYYRGPIINGGFNSHGVVCVAQWRAKGVAEGRASARARAREREREREREADGKQKPKLGRPGILGRAPFSDRRAFFPSLKRRIRLQRCILCICREFQPSAGGTRVKGRGGTLGRWGCTVWRWPRRGWWRGAGGAEERVEQPGIGTDGIPRIPRGQLVSERFTVL
jgi:hypothetical protein